MSKYVLALDQGTTSSRSIVFDEKGKKVSVSQKEFTQFFPSPGLVEHDAMEIWASQKVVMEEAARAAGVSDIAAIGITNQRETTVVWDAVTGRPVCNAIVWQDRRTSEYCDSLISRGLTEVIRDRTGLIIDSYFSATKIKWILDNVPGARARAEAGELRFGTVDTWLVWNLTGGRAHITDVSNASRTMLFNIHSLDWDKDLLDLFGIPASMLPQVKSSSEVYGYTEIDGVKIPIASVIGDQQSALFGQMCVTPGAVKNTYGTGCFLLMNTGSRPVRSRNNLLTTVAWKIGDKVDYVLEGSVFVAGALTQWLRDGLGIIGSSSEIEPLALTVPDNGGVVFVPALTGLAAPYWKHDARGSITGISRGTTAGHIARAALEGIALEVMDVVKAMQDDAGILLGELKVDGGASRNNLLMQIQADLLDTEVIRPMEKETTALGAAYLAGLAVGLWDSVESLKSLWQEEKRFRRNASADTVSRMKSGWSSAVSKVIA